MNKGKIFLIVIVFLWSMVSLVLIIRQTGLPYYPRYDSGAYYVAAVSILEGEGLTEINHPEKPPFILYPPLYPLVLSSQILLFGHNYSLVVLHLMFLFAATCYLCFHFFDPPFNLWVLLLLSVSNLAVFATRIQAEIPLAFGVMLFFLLHRKHPFHWINTLVLSLLPLVKPIGFIVVAAFGIESLILLIQKKKSISFLLHPIAAVFPFLVWSLLSQPWMLNPSTTPLLQTDWGKEHVVNLPAGELSFVQKASSNIWDLMDHRIPQSFIFSDFGTREGARFPHMWYLGVLVLLGLPILFRRSRLAGLTILIHLILLSVIPVLSARYISVFFPFYAYMLILLFNYLSKFTGVPSVNNLIRVPILLLALFSVVFTLHVPAEMDLWRAFSANAMIARCSAERIPVDAVVLTNDHYGFFCVTGIQAFSYLDSEQKSPRSYNLKDYLRRGGRLTHAAIFSYEYKKFMGFLPGLGLRPKLYFTQDDVVIMELVHEDH